MLDAKSALQHQDIVGHIQQGRGGFGLGGTRTTWQKANPTERRLWVVEEVRRQEEADRCARAIAQGKQGCWMRWNAVEKKTVTWNELRGMELNMLSFIIRATYDVLTSLTNLNLWMGEDPVCPLCSMPASLKHILVGCKASLTQGRYTWWHNQVLRCLAAKVETRRITINAMPLPTQDKFQQAILFVREGEKPKSNSLPPGARQLRGARDWEMRTDLD